MKTYTEKINEAFPSFMVFRDAQNGEKEMLRMERFLGMIIADSYLGIPLPNRSDFVKELLERESVQEWINYYLIYPENIDYANFPYDLSHYDGSAYIEQYDDEPEGIELPAEEYDEGEF